MCNYVIVCSLSSGANVVVVCRIQHRCSDLYRGLLMVTGVHGSNGQSAHCLVEQECDTERELVTAPSKEAVV